ncbi:MAG: hypothetical protein M3Y41_01590, partial [Pseudomonadota bacterium]|nr:hypothetical protein [Pseudomonadota bacterium]
PPPAPVARSGETARVPPAGVPAGDAAHPANVPPPDAAGQNALEQQRDQLRAELAQLRAEIARDSDDVAALGKTATPGRPSLAAQRASDRLKTAAGARRAAQSRLAAAVSDASLSARGAPSFASVEGLLARLRQQREETADEESPASPAVAASPVASASSVASASPAANPIPSASQVAVSQVAASQVAASQAAERQFAARQLTATVNRPPSPPVTTRLMQARTALAAGQTEQARMLLQAAATQLVFRPGLPAEPDLAGSGSVAAGQVRAALGWLNAGDPMRALQFTDLAIAAAGSVLPTQATAQAPGGSGPDVSPGGPGGFWYR